MKLLGLPDVSIGDAFRLESMRLHVDRAPHTDDVRIAVVMRVPDIRDQTQTTEVVFTRQMSAELFSRGSSGRLSEMWEREVYSLLREALLHELDEHFRVDGKRVRDPHRDEVP